MKAAYKLQLEKHQRRLGLTHKELNRETRKYNAITLLKQLQLLNPKVSAPAEPSGFWGYFRIYNETAVESASAYFHATFEINDIAIEGPIKINGGANHIFTIPIENRAALPTSIFKLKVTFEDGVTAVDLNGIDGFTIVSFTNNSLQEENTMSMMINDPNFIEEGFLRVDFTITAVKKK